jgi:hypothetical protein
MTHPYRDLPDHAFWRRAVAGPAMGDVDPVTAVPFRIQPTDRIATAGSCFAQHIARTLREAGLAPLVTETAHPMAPPELATRYGYGIYTARTGNIYTARQLLQLFDRAHGEFLPREDVWEVEGGFVDPFRPQIAPEPFLTRAELKADRQQHFAAVRRAFRELTVFVFTLGLTECWLSREDGAAFPLCPGVAGGAFDPDRHVMRNFTASEVASDMTAFIDRLRRVNPTARMIVTVSPVPLIATAAGRHVLVSTTYSKSALRVACEELVAARPDIAYFPSYEIVTGPHARGAYFAPDLRSVNEAGVAHVMRVFLRHFARSGAPDAPVRAPQPDRHIQEMAAHMRVVCDEEALDIRP